MSSTSNGAPLRFGIVGCGTIAPTHAGALQNIGDAKLTACCDVVAERANDFAARYGIDSAHVHTSLDSFLLDLEVDAVSVCAPSGLHAEIGVRALHAGKPVIVEKPMDVTEDACDTLIAAQRDTGLALAVISQHRFDSSTLTARRLIDGGSLGKIVLVEAQVKWYRTQEYYDSGDWRGTWAMDGGGALMNQGVHTIDLMRWLAGPVTSVYAVARTSAHERIEVEDVVCATLTFANGAIGNLVASTAAYPGFPATLSIHGDAGSVVIAGDVLQSVQTKQAAEGVDGSEPATHAMQVAQGGTKSAEDMKEAEKTTGSSNPGAIWGDAHQAQLEDFIAAVRFGRQPVVDGVAGREAVRVVRAVYESARMRSVVNL